MGHQSHRPLGGRPAPRVPGEGGAGAGTGSGTPGSGTGSGTITFAKTVVLPNAKACVSQTSLKIKLKRVKQARPGPSPAGARTRPTKPAWLLSGSVRGMGEHTFDMTSLVTPPKSPGRPPPGALSVRLAA